MTSDQAATTNSARRRRGAALALCALALTACSDDPAEPPEPPKLADRGELTIYSSLPLQGDSKPQSKDLVRAFRLALDAHDGTAAGYDIKLVSLDDADPELGFFEPGHIAANAEQAAGDPSTIAYVGEFNSGASVVSLPILNQAGILQVSPSNTYVGLTRADGAEAGEPDKYYPTGRRTYGRVVPADHVQAGALVSAMRDRGCTDVFIAHDDETYGRGIADAVASSAQQSGIEVVGNVPLDATTKSAFEAAAPTCFFLGAITQNGAPEVANDIAATRPETKMFFPDGCAESAFTEQLDPGVAENVFITNPTLEPASYPAAGQAFYADFEEAFGHAPEPYAIYGYEALSVVLDSIDAAGEAAAPTPDGRAAVVSAFFATSGRDSVLGTYGIDDYGDTTLAAYGGYTVQGGELVFDSVIEPAVVESATGPELTATPDPAPSTSESESTAASPIEGTWLGGKVTRAMLLRERSPKEVRAVFESNGARQSMVSRLEVLAYDWHVSTSGDGGPFVDAQSGVFNAKGHLIHLTDDSGARYTYRYRLDGDTLTIRLVESDAGMAGPGVSDDAFQYGQFAAPFTRAD